MKTETRVDQAIAKGIDVPAHIPYKLQKSVCWMSADPTLLFGINTVTNPTWRLTFENPVS